MSKAKKFCPYMTLDHAQWSSNTGFNTTAGQDWLLQGPWLNTEQEPSSPPHQGDIEYSPVRGVFLVQSQGYLILTRGANIGKGGLGYPTGKEQHQTKVLNKTFFQIHLRTPNYSNYIAATCTRQSQKNLQHPNP